MRKDGGVVTAGAEVIACFEAFLSLMLEAKQGDDAAAAAPAEAAPAATLEPAATVEPAAVVS